MNHTEQAKVDMAKKMLKGQIDVEEVAMMSGLSLETVQKMRDEQDALERKSLGGLTVREAGIDNVLIDNDILDESQVETDQLFASEEAVQDE
jgi:hypothetical protein